MSSGNIRFSPTSSGNFRFPALHQNSSTNLLLFFTPQPIILGQLGKLPDIFWDTKPFFLHSSHDLCQIPVGPIIFKHKQSVSKEQGNHTEFHLFCPVLLQIDSFPLIYSPKIRHQHWHEQIFNFNSCLLKHVSSSFFLWLNCLANRSLLSVFLLFSLSFTNKFEASQR